MSESARDLERVVELLWQKAESGSVTAQVALLRHLRSDPAQPLELPPGADLEALYGNDRASAAAFDALDPPTPTRNGAQPRARPR